MASIINTNVASLNAQRNLTSSQSSLATSLQRLSSGLRINSAKDDAAGLAISDRFTTQIRGLNQAARNANDAISLSQTAEGALGELSTNLQRIRELAVQSANATNSSSDRAAIDLEVQQRLAEVERISSQTSFNGQKILDGTFGNAAFQVGANVGETITIDLATSMRPGAIGKLATATSVDLSDVIDPEAAPPLSLTVNDDFKITLGDSTAVSVADGPYTSAQDLVDAVNTALAGNATATLNDDGTMSIFSDEDVTISGTVGLTTLGLAGFTEADGSLTGGNILDVAGSNDIIRRTDSALTSISDLRSTFGAIQNRFESTITNLNTAVENLSASRSRIMDADFAAETANLTRAQILQQAGTAMLAQANALPQNVLSLLQG
ncbi:MAG: flagellin [Gammaproteobacteria bacterium]|nr:flagellin [Gammaproteobacteria bacterium]